MMTMLILRECVLVIVIKATSGASAIRRLRLLSPCMILSMIEYTNMEVSCMGQGEKQS